MEASLLAGWENFYVITGSSAGGLTGVTFVVIALAAERHSVKITGLRAFVTPIIMHFGVVLALAAYLSVPHQSRMTLSFGLGAAALTGLAYGTSTVANMLRQGADYSPVVEDWAWNVVLPMLLYGVLLGMALLVWRNPSFALYGVGAVSLLFLFIGIRNAWDIAVWMTVSREREPH